MSGGPAPSRSRVLGLARAVGPTTLLRRIAMVLVAVVGVVLIAAGIGGLRSAGTIDRLRHASGAHTVTLVVDATSRHCRVRAGSGTVQSRRDCSYTVTGHYVDTDGRAVAGASLYPDPTRAPGPTVRVIVSPGHRTTALDASTGSGTSRVLGGVALGVGVVLVLLAATLVVRRRRRLRP